jgi:hypothetical protein
VSEIRRRSWWDEKLRKVADVKGVAEAEEASVARNRIGERRIRERFDRL